MNIRVADVDDVSAIAAVHCAAALTAYAHIFPRDAEAPTPESLALEYAALVADPYAAVYVAEDVDIVGCVALHSDPHVPSGWLLSRLYVTPSKWRVGIGAALHDHLLAVARERELATLHLWTLGQRSRPRDVRTPRLAAPPRPSPRQRRLRPTHRRRPLRAAAHSTRALVIWGAVSAPEMTNAGGVWMEAAVSGSRGT